MVIFIAVLSLFIGNPISANAEWECDTTDWYYTDGDSYLTGWQFLDGNWYYFYSDGYMAHDCWIGNYYLNSSGAWTDDIPTVTDNDSSVTTSKDKTAMVYVASSGNGKKYHSNPNCSRMKGTRCISISEAEAEGYTPCKKCY